MTHLLRQDSRSLLPEVFSTLLTGDARRILDALAWESESSPRQVLESLLYIAAAQRAAETLDELTLRGLTVETLEGAHLYLANVAKRHETDEYPATMDRMQEDERLSQALAVFAATYRGNIRPGADDND